MGACLDKMTCCNDPECRLATPPYSQFALQCLSQRVSRDRRRRIHSKESLLPLILELSKFEISEAETKNKNKIKQKALLGSKFDGVIII